MSITSVDPQPAVNEYFAMWNTTHDVERRRLVEATFEPGAVFCDPVALATGHDEIEQLVTDIQAQFPGSTYTLDSAVDQHHDRLRYRWTMRDATGAEVLEGHDTAVISSDGRLVRVDGFFGPLAGA